MKRFERCQVFNLVAARADAFEAYGNLSREKGEIDKANDYYQRAARAYDEPVLILREPN
jgi:hypothetical protein